MLKTVKKVSTKKEGRGRGKWEGEGEGGTLPDEYRGCEFFFTYFEYSRQFKFWRSYFGIQT